MVYTWNFLLQTYIAKYKITIEHTRHKFYCRIYKGLIEDDFHNENGPAYENIEGNKEYWYKGWYFISKESMNASKINIKDWNHK